MRTCEGISAVPNGLSGDLEVVAVAILEALNNLETVIGLNATLK